MKTYDLIKSFARDDSGAVTVDWVVLTAAIVGLGIAVITAISGGVGGLGGGVASNLNNLTVDAIDVTGIHGAGGGGGGEGDGDGEG